MTSLNTHRLLQRSVCWTAGLHTCAVATCPSCCCSICRGLQPRNHVTATMMKLHWLPVRQRITYKLCCLIHGVVHGHAPEYVVDMVVPVSHLPGRSHLRSAQEATSTFHAHDCLRIQIVLYCCSTGLEWITSWHPRHHDNCYIQETPQDIIV